MCGLRSVPNATQRTLAWRAPPWSACVVLVIVVADLWVVHPNDGRKCTEAVAYRKYVQTCVLEV